MQVVGYVMLAVGVALMGFALNMGVSIDPDPRDGVVQAIANNDLMNQRLLYGFLGSGAFISGWLAIIAHRIGPRP